MVHFNDYFLPDNYDKLVERNYSEAVLRDHEIVKKLGEGAFGHVYLGRLRKDNGLVAIKKISKQKGKPEVFRKEYANFKNLLHPFLIQYHGYYESQDHYNFVLEYASNGTLDEKIAERAVSKNHWKETEILKMFTDILVGLEYLHDSGVIHRDLKPDNIVIGQNGRLKITDFGVAKVMEATGNEHLYASKFGPKCYAAPELLEGKAYDSSVDYWSLGVIMYELCTLEHPFLDKELGEKLARIPQIYSKNLDGIITELLLEVDPQERVNEEDLKMESLIRPHYDAAIRDFNSYWAQRVMRLGTSDDEDDEHYSHYF